MAKMDERLEKMAERYCEINDLMMQSDVVSDRKTMAKLGREQNELTPIVETYEEYKKAVDELEEAKELLIKQKPLVQAYVIDQVRDKMIGNEAAIGVIYSGEAIYTQLENPNLEYVIPKEGSNVWIDSWVIPKNAKHKENAEDFINFLCRPDIAKMNFDYITYSIPNSAGRELIEDESMRESNIAFPDISQLKNCETFNFLGDENEIIYNQLWREIKSK